MSNKIEPSDVNWANAALWAIAATFPFGVICLGAPYLLVSLLEFQWRPFPWAALWIFPVLAVGGFAYKVYEEYRWLKDNDER